MLNRKDSAGAWRAHAEVAGMHKMGFWPVDAAFALVLAVAMFAIFSAILYAAGSSAARGADDASGELLSARFSTYALQRLEAGEEIDLQALLAGVGRSYASLRAGDGFSEAGVKGGSVYCTARLALVSGNITKVEACVG